MGGAEHGGGVGEIAEAGDGEELGEFGAEGGEELKEAVGDEVGVELLEMGEGSAAREERVELRHRIRLGLDHVTSLDFDRTTGAEAGLLVGH